MSWYYGTPEQQTLQRKIDDCAVQCRTTPGAVNAGRMFGTDDIRSFGWDAIFTHLEEDGFFTFRMVPMDGRADVEAQLAIRGYIMNWWNVFSGPAHSVRERVNDPSLTVLPDGYFYIETADLTQNIVHEMQACMSRNGVKPYSGRMIAGLTEPSVSVAICNPDGVVVATAVGHRPYNSLSENHATAWGGLVAVDNDQRGKRLGVAANAQMLRGCIDDLGAETLQEFVAATNMVSRRMVERCGLRIDDTCMSGIASSGADRFTR